jgi:hypothetical protein
MQDFLLAITLAVKVLDLLGNRSDDVSLRPFLFTCKVDFSELTITLSRSPRVVYNLVCTYLSKSVTFEARRPKYDHQHQQQSTPFVTVAFAY